MNEWFERNEMNDINSGGSSIDLGLLSSKSPRRTGSQSIGLNHENDIYLGSSKKGKEIYNKYRFHYLTI